MARKQRIDLDALEASMGIKRLDGFRPGQKVKYVGPWEQIKGKILTVESCGQKKYLCKIPGMQCSFMYPEELEAVS